MPLWPFGRRPKKQPVTPQPSAPPRAASQLGAMPIKVAPKPITCPHCGVVLDIEPVRKRKCPECRETIVPKQALGDVVKRFYTEDQALAIDEEIKAARKEKRLRDLQIQLKATEKAGDTVNALILRARINLVNGDRDGAWRCWNEASIEAAKQCQGGMFRVIRYYQAEQLIKEGRTQAAIPFLCEVLYLDYCRVANIWAEDQKGRRIYMPFFDKYHRAELAKRGIHLDDYGPNPSFAPGVVSMLARAADEVGLSVDELGKLFCSECQERGNAMRAPYPAADAWRELREYLV